MRPATVLVLALVVALLAAFVWFVDRDLPSSEERAEEAKRLLPLEVEEVEAVTVAWGETVVRAERTAASPETEGEAGWRLVKPIEGPAEGWEVEGLLRALARLETVRTMRLGEGAEASAVGLASPRGRVTLALRGDRERTLLVGATVPASSAVVVGLVGPGSAEVPEEAEVVDAAFVGRLERLAADPESWRRADPEPVEPDPEVEPEPGSDAAGSELESPP